MAAPDLLAATVSPRQQRARSEADVMMSADVGGLRLDDLYSFVVLAQELHFGNAAARLYLTRGGLSRRIRRLEGALCATLLSRTTRRVSLSRAGSQFLPVASLLVAEVAAVRNASGLAAAG